jgi:hypothetical protein
LATCDGESTKKKCGSAIESAFKVPLVDAMARMNYAFGGDWNHDMAINRECGGEMVACSDVTVHSISDEIYLVRDVSAVLALCPDDILKEDIMIRAPVWVYNQLKNI